MTATAVLPDTPLAPTPAFTPAPNPRELGPALTERPHRAVFLAMLAEALSSYGMATHELEESVARCADRLSIPARVSATPTSILLMIGPEDDERTRLILPNRAGVNLTRLAELARVARQVENGELTAREGIEEIRTALRARPRPSLLAETLGAGALAAGVLVVLGAQPADLAVGGAIGALVALTLAVCARVGRLSRVGDFAAAAAAAALATCADRFAGPVDIFPVTLAGLLPLLPGLSLTIAIAEIAAGSMVSGASRLIGALTVLLSLGFGGAIGFKLAGAESLAIVAGAPAAYPWWAQGLALVAAGFAMLIAFRARWRDLPVILGACLLATLSARYAAAHFGPEFSALGGAFAVGVAALAYERLAKAPSQIALLPGILLLVPGSVGFKSVRSFLDADAIAGVEGVFTMFVIAVGIVTGLLLASVLTPPAPRPAQLGA